MSIKIYNTLSRKKEDFKTLQSGKVSMYVCGPTVYDKAHVGHAMSALVFDIVRRYLEYQDYEVSHVTNYTDVDDRIIQRAAVEGVDAKEIAQRYIDEYDQHLKDLNILPASQYPRATEEIDRIIEAVADLVEKGYAYPSNGDVYYRVEKFPGYGKLSGRKIDDMEAGFRIDVDDRKEHPMDFALWKAAKLGEPFTEIKKYGELFKFLVAFWLYNDGIGTIIKMATIYGKEINIGQIHLIGAILMVQFVGIPFSFAFGWLAKRIGTKKSIYLSLGVYTLISIGGYFMYSAIHFWILGFAVALVQGGSQALSRSLYGRMVPKAQSAEFFSFFSVSGKLAGFFGPLIFGLVSQMMGNSRLGIVSLVIFFISGALLLTRVDEEKGIRVAKEADALAAQNA